MKSVLITLLVLISAVVAFIAWYQFDSAQNHGYEFGYYGDFNRVSNALVFIPAIQVTEFLMNRDVTLEEFGFKVVKASGDVVWITFGERDPVRELSGDRLHLALKKQLEAAVPLSNAAPHEIILH
jgi:hypothetical protein